MAWSVVQVKSGASLSNAGNPATQSVTMTSTGSGNLLVAFIACSDKNKTVNSVSDGTNSFTQFPSATFNSVTTNPVDWMADCWYLLSSTSGKTSITVTFSGGVVANGVTEIFCYEITGVTTPARDGTSNQSTAQTGSGTTDTGPSFTTAGASDGIAIGYIVVNDAVSVNPKAGNAFTSSGLIDGVTSDAVCSLLRPSNTSQTPVWTDAGSAQSYQSMLVAFKETGGAAATPITPTELPRPILARQWDRGWVQSTNLSLLLNAGAMPTPSPDLSVNRRPQPNTDWVMGSDMALLGTQGAQPAPPPDVSIWRQSPGSAQTWVVGLNLAIQPISTQTPFNQTDWPVTRPAARTPDLLTWVSWFVIDDNVPFNQTDWPFPRGASYPQDNHTFLSQPFLETLGKLVFPSKLLDWPTPQRAPQPAQTWLQSLPLWAQNIDQFFGMPGQPVTTMDWPLTRQPRVETRSWTQNLLESTIAPTPPPPFNQTDYTGVRAATYPIALRTWLQSVVLELLHQDQFFGGAGQPVANLDQPRARAATYPGDLRTFLLNLMESTLAPPPPAFKPEWALNSNVVIGPMAPQPVIK